MVTRRNQNKTRRGAARDRFKGKSRVRESSTLIGRLSMNRRGFGFIAPESPGPDVLVRAWNLGGAMQGDRVSVRVARGSRGWEGEVIEVLERGTNFVSGVLRIAGKHAWIEPDDERIQRPIALSQAPAIKANSADRVIARITRYPRSPGEMPQGDIVEVLDVNRPIEFELGKILLCEGVRQEFTQQVLAQARQLPQKLSAGDKRRREDLRGIELVTIDPADARDHDDAVWAERLENGGYRAVIAIADVSHYVQPGSALDQEALARGCTIYLPDRAIPMLPPELSTNLASLVPKRDRLALALEVEIAPEGAVLSHRLIRAVIRSRARLHYQGVARALGFTNRAEAQPAADARKPLLRTLFDLSELLRKRRIKRGALMFDLPEARVKLDPATGEPVDIERSRVDPGVARAYNLVEELMLLANEVVALDLAGRGVAAIYRVHPHPDERLIENFVSIAGMLGYKLDSDSVRKPKKLARFLLKVADSPHAGNLEYLLLRAMQQASYDTTNTGHFALAAEHYLHFTSPIRRYPDLAIHRIVSALARGKLADLKQIQPALKVQAEQSSRLERRAMKVEREVVDLYRALLMRDKIGESFDATVVGIAEHGIYCSLDAPFVDVLCRFSCLGEERYERDALGLKAVGVRSGKVFALGDRLRVRIVESVIARRQVLALPQKSPTCDRRARSRREQRANETQDSDRERREKASKKPRAGKIRPRTEADNGR
ncbi:MAG: VacB/RNase II family 3'-5' exoribonuclease [Deltaproteobacteria bacterium]|nr:VacB/RNase II family 3'-5' exoribonuclease [Deltaproteobacteria bacterium]